MRRRSACHHVPSVMLNAHGEAWIGLNKQRRTTTPAISRVETRRAARTGSQAAAIRTRRSQRRARVAGAGAAATLRASVVRPRTRDYMHNASAIVACKATTPTTVDTAPDDPEVRAAATMNAHRCADAGLMRLSRWQPMVSFSLFDLLSLERESNAGAQLKFIQGNIREELLNCIATHGAGQVAVAAVAWVTSKTILRALTQHCRCVIFVINREAFGEFADGRTLAKYEILPPIPAPISVLFRDFESPLKYVETGRSPGECSGFPKVSPYGLPSMGQNQGNKIMHDKFIVFFKRPAGAATSDGLPLSAGLPHTVWFGSFNFTKRAECNQETVTLLENMPKVADYFAQSFALSFCASNGIHSASHRRLR